MILTFLSLPDVFCADNIYTDILGNVDIRVSYMWLGADEVICHEVHEWHWLSMTSGPRIRIAEFDILRKKYLPDSEKTPFDISFSLIMS
jgi:hypothetical protein